MDSEEVFLRGYGPGGSHLAAEVEQPDGGV